RRFNSAWPRARDTLVCRNSMELLQDLDAGEVDITLTTDTSSDGHCETLRWDKLVWVGAPGGDAHTRDPLPISIGGKTCRFRPVALQALRDIGRTWQVILAVSNQEAVSATIASGSCIGFSLRDCIPDMLEQLPRDSGLQELPDFAINLWLPKAETSSIAAELARHIRADFAARYPAGGDVTPLLTSRRTPKRAAALVQGASAVRRAFVR
ncbi:MAG: LysR substrate-binding domain-containing protein, partial [Hyphomicrobiaceae bacterium]